jgi:hypothetical protein
MGKEVNMDITFLTDYMSPIIVGICLCVGYILKNFVPDDKVNKFIPLIMGVLGVVLNVWAQRGISPEIILMGMFSGLASTGLHQTLKNLIAKEE